MFDDESEIRAHADAQWTELNDAVLKAPDAEMWAGLVDRFEPFPRAPSEEMTETLREGVRQRNMEIQTRAIHNDELLGFYSVERVRTQISDLSEAILGVANALRLRSLKPGLLVSSIVRSDLTDPGFGQVLLEDVVALALADKDLEAIFVKPANSRVAEMWKSDYCFEPVASSEIPGLLYFPLDVED